ncbi:MAG: protein-L-isoaspartate O-methyltransferase [Candidatus Pacebacteria bacterium]|nr:protein-L-isoaspartate O-methyltransferase [Candidatus Paceibacterota bacterium]
MKKLVEKLINEGVLKNKSIIDSFIKTDRKDFITSEYKKDAYQDIALSIGFGQTISQPFTVAFMLELLQPKLGDDILDVGSGSGWTTALLSQIVGENGKVFGTEIIPELVKFGSSNLKKFNFKNTKIIQSKPNIIGLPSEAPFDKILVSASSDTLPKEFIHQLKIGGTIVIPIKESIWKISKKSEIEIEIEKFDGFKFVPLIK